MFGCAPDTGNLGVSALCESVVSGLRTRGLGHDLAVADYARGSASPTRATAGIQRFGYIPGRRWNRPENAARIRLELASGLALGASARLLKRAACFLDISGGDSFTDLYGPRRFASISKPKLLAMRTRKPLILLPQTYGPYHETGNRRIAQRIVRYASQAWARDARSYEILRDLLGPTFDPARHRLGVDVAFLLPASPADRLLEANATPIAGINVSGLIWNDPDSAASRYGFKADYRKAMVAIVSTLAASMPVLLVPHVLTPPGHYESDRSACEALVAALASAVRSRVRICPDPADASEAKGVIARCDWFCGMRMHATIAALSSGVPTAAISYSDKTLGVFETCGQGEHVHDPRRLDTDALVQGVLASWERREAARRSLADRLPAVLALAEQQMDEIAAACRPSSIGRPSIAPATA